MRKTPILVVALVLLGCSNRHFNTPQLLDIPRVLALQAEPPQPKVGTPTTVQALVYIPAGDLGEGASYSWKWCPFPTSSNNDYECPIDQAGFDEIYASFGLGAAPSLDLGTGKTATLVNPFPAAILEAICTNQISLQPGKPPASPDAGSICPYGGLKGFPVTIYLSIGPTSLGILDAVDTVYLPTDDTVPGNQNPILGGVQATWKNAPDGGATAVDTQPEAASPPEIDAGELTLDAGEATDGAAASAPIDAAGVNVGEVSGSNGVLLDEAFTTTVPRDKEIKLHLQLPDTSSEAFPPALADAIDQERNPKLLKDGTRTLAKRDTEQLDAYWFTEAGEFGDGDARANISGFLGFPADSDSLISRLTDIKWTPPKSEDYKDGKTRLIVVVRDRRGGTAWTFATASLEPKP